MENVIESPTVLRIRETDEAKLALLRGAMTYTDKSVEYQIRRLKQAHWFDAERHADALDDLNADKRKCVIYEDDKGLYTLSGLATDVDNILRCGTVNEVSYPAPDIIPWSEEPPPLRDYQEEIVSIFLEHKHAAAEIATGLGKSFILMHIAKRLGLKTVVMAPTTSIADQLYEDFTKFLGRKRVGRFYGGKKETGKLVTIAIHASLARQEPGSDAYQALSEARVFIADESHLTPAATLRKVCLGMCASAPYRFFLSGTQLRADGAELLLRGITGPILKRMTVVDGVNQGWLAKPRFRMFNVISSDGYASSDPLKMTQTHFYYNPIIIRKATALANFAVERMGHQVLIAIEEVDQFRHIIPHLRAQFKFAHGPLDKNNAKLVPPAYHDSDTTAIVKSFNAGEFPILIGTSAVGMGTDIRPVKTIINLTGGKSEVQVRQLVGRGTRRVAGKDECMVFDFDVENVPLVHRHAQERIAIYADIYPDVDVLL